MTVLWVTDSATPGALRCLNLSGGAAVFTASSSPKKADALGYSPSEQNHFPPVRTYAPSYVHEITIAGLRPGTEYRYEVTQGTAVFAAGFKTAPNPASVRAGTWGVDATAALSARASLCGLQFTNADRATHPASARTSIGPCYPKSRPPS